MQILYFINNHINFYLHSGSIPPQNIPRIDLRLHVVQAHIIAVGDNRLRSKRSLPSGRPTMMRIG